jgi:hypothetical protein
MGRVRRFLVTGLIALVVVLGSAASAAAASHVRLRNFICQPALDPASRAVSVTAVMRPLAGTEKMAMRFDLLRRARPGARAFSVAGPKLGSWAVPKDPTLGQLPGDVWVVHHPVVDLTAPAIYRFKVAFRWTDANGKVIGTAVRFTRKCSQPELRADIRVLGVQATPLPSGLDRYRVTVRNGGKNAAGFFKVSLAIGASPTMIVATPQPVQSLDPHMDAVVNFRAPPCSAGQELMVLADPEGAIDDANRANNTLTTTCPTG